MKKNKNSLAVYLQHNLFHFFVRALKLTNQDQHHFSGIVVGILCIHEWNKVSNSLQKGSQTLKKHIWSKQWYEKPSPFLFTPRPNLWTQNSDKCRIDKAAKCLSQIRYFWRNNKVRFCVQHLHFPDSKFSAKPQGLCFKLMHTVVNSWPQIQNFQTLYNNIWPRKFERNSLQQNRISTRIDHFLHLGKTADILLFYKHFICIIHAYQRSYKCLNFCSF